MSDGVRELGVGHDYAPDAEPGPYETMMTQIAEVLTAPAFAGLVVAGVVVILGLHRLRGRRGGGDVSVESGGGAARSAAYAEMRRRRQARAGAGTPGEADQPPRSDAAV
jgi:hypothetical protein